ncbi:DUF1294 domain-containing protein [Cytobacillus gottheilii]|uniref:DUF1294 domain-containing protein n=1 Tax=Cytobacillus gottheilii TaxID=859144 RepID=A0ABX8FAY6_9BACI|nr:DUF1294 domain-containing protein [Cytobacillus gottheilii]QVY60626.1 DUF1294 domain-containing protein [Cytobacillus gottheilii]
MILISAAFIIIAINIVGFLIMMIDKRKAVKQEYRISEKTLWTVAIFFGAAGMTVGMNMFRHKTKHTQFKIGLPLLTIIQLVILYFLPHII